MKIKWSKQAKIVLDEVIQYGELTFGTKATTKLILRIEQCCSLLAIYPRMGNIEPLLCDLDKEYRSWVVHKHYKIIYVIYEAQDEIYIVDLWDTRQEPDKLILFK